MKIKRALLAFVAICAAISVLAGLGGCTSRIKAQNLMVGIVANSANKTDADGDFSRALAGFSLRLFSDTVKRGQKSGNILVSPFCVNTVLSMTANGAKGKTLEELSGALANGMDINRLNAYYNAFLAGLKEEEKCKMTSSGSIWFKDDKSLNVKQDFLQKNADFYRSEIYKAKFDKSTADDINLWVKKNTDGMIENIIDEISPESMMYLISTLCFDAEWEVPYSGSTDREFTSLSGEKRTVQMMLGDEYSYIDDGKATGFTKRYYGGKYSFVALLPNEDIPVYDYIEYLGSVDEEQLLGYTTDTQDTMVQTGLPKFKFDYSAELTESLKEMGINRAFDPLSADFSGMNETGDLPLYIGSVIHKTFIEVDEQGTRAAAAAAAEMKCGAAMPPDDVKEVILDRPFVFMITDAATGIPMFMGAVTDITENV